MTADSSHGNPTGKRPNLPRWAAWMISLLRRFWLTLLALLIVVLVGLLAGWSTPRQWSDALFIDAFAQIVIAGAIVANPGETYDASTMRYVDQGNVTETFFQLLRDTARKKKFGVRAFLGGVLTLGVAELALWV